MSTLKQFNYLITIVEEGSFIAASEKLFIAQSALSRQIKILEEELDFEIVDRSEKKIKLTPAGHVLYKNIKNNINKLKSSIALAQGVSRGDGRTIKIAHSSSIIIDENKLKILDQLSQKYNIEIEINTLSSELQIESILQGSTDLGMIRPPIYHSLLALNSVSLYTAALYVAVNCSDPFFHQKQSLHISELEMHNFVSIPHDDRGGLSYLASNLCLSYGFAPRKSRIRSRKVSQLDLVAHSFGICIVPEEFREILPQNVRLIPIEGDQHSSEVKLIWKKETDDIINKCADLLQDFFKNQI